MIHDIIHVLKSQPVVGGEEVQGTERRGAADNAFVTAEFLHPNNVVRREIEAWDQIVQSSQDGFRVCILVLLRQSASGSHPVHEAYR